MIARELASQLRAAAKESPAVTVTGPRQSGKTTLLQAVFPRATYVHLEEPDVLAFARQDPRGFVRAHPRPVILDEIQYAPNLLPYLKAEIDRTRKRKGQFFLTGSQSFALMAPMSESLAGRTAHLHLLPLTASEMINNTRKTTIEKVIFRGFYPELHASAELSGLKSYTRWQASYIRTFVERDVRRISNVGDLAQFERFVRLLAARSGNLLNLSELGRDAGVEQPTAKRWQGVLQAGFVAFELLPFHRNFSKRMIKSPKTYFYDTGLCRYLMGIRETTQLRINQAFGALFETLVVSDIKKSIAHRNINADLSFYRSSDGLEVDLLISAGSNTRAFEIKATATPRLDQLGPLRRWMLLTKTKIATVLCLVDEPTPLGHGITAVPWWDHSRYWN